jgi:hypothetical protein
MTQPTAAQLYAAQVKADRKARAAERRDPNVKQSENQINRMFASTGKAKKTTQKLVDGKVQYRFVERKGQLIAELSKLRNGEIPVLTILHEEWTNALHKLQPKLDRIDTRSIHPIYGMMNMLVEATAPNLRNASINWLVYSEVMKSEFGQHYSGTFREVQTGLNPVMDAEQAKEFRAIVSPQILQFCQKHYRSIN